MLLQSGWIEIHVLVLVLGFRRHVRETILFLEKKNNLEKINKLV